MCVASKYNMQGIHIRMCLYMCIYTYAYININSNIHMQHNDLYMYISRSYFKATRKTFHLDDLSDMPLAPKLLFILWHIVFLSWLITHLVSKFYLKYFKPNKETSSIMLVDHLITGTPAYLTAALTVILQIHSTRICTCIIHHSVIYCKKN